MTRSWIVKEHVHIILVVDFKPNPAGFTEAISLIIARGILTQLRWAMFDPSYRNN